MKIETSSHERTCKANITFLVKKNGRITYYHVDYKKHKKLIDDIDKTVAESYSKLKTVNDYFNTNFCMCEFKNDKKRNHSTFIEENGFYYIEKHHLIMSKLKKQYQNINDFDIRIDKEENLFYLCPLCHREIHHAKKEVKREKIKFLYEKRKSFFDQAFNDLKGAKNTLEWLYSIYNCENDVRKEK